MFNQALEQMSAIAEELDLSLAFFDLETTYGMDVVEPDWNELSWEEKQGIREEVLARVGLGLAGVLWVEKTHSFHYFKEGEVNDLKNLLDRVDVIVGHNLLKFDYPVLDPHFPTLPLIRKTIDTFDLLRRETGLWVRLDEVIQKNFGVAKPMSGVIAPYLIRREKWKEVTEYLRNDLLFTLLLFLAGMEEKELALAVKQWGETVGYRKHAPRWRARLLRFRPHLVFRKGMDDIE